MPTYTSILRTQKPTIIFIVGLLSFLFMGTAILNAATITTTGSGNWNSTVANAPWPSGIVPAVGDIVIIANGHTVNLTSAVTKTGSSTVTVNQGGVLNLNATLTIPASAAAEITISGTLNLNVVNALQRTGNGGAGSNAVVTATGIVDLTTTAANENVTVWDLQTGSTLKLSAAGNQTLDADFVGAAVDNLTLSGSGIKTLGENTTVSQIMSIEGAASFATGGFTLNYGAGATLRYLTTDTHTTGTEWPATFSGTGGVIIGNTAGTVTLGGAKVLNTATPLTINSGSTLITNNFQLTLGNNFTNNGGTFTAGTGTVIFNGNSSAINGTASTQSFYNITVNKTTGQTLSVGGSTTTLNVGGAFTQTTGNFTAPTTMSVTGNTTLTAGTFTANTDLNLTGNFTNNGATFTPGTGTITFVGSTSAINGTAATQTFNNLVVNKTSGQTLSVGGSTTTLNIGGAFTQTSGNFTAPATMAVTGNAILTAGTYTANTNLTVSGDFTNNGATFTPGTGTVTMNGSAKTIGGSSAFTFNNLTINNAGGILLGNSQTVNGTLTLTSGRLTLGSNNLTLGAASPAVAGTLSASNMIVTDGIGELRKNFSAIGSYVFPVGETSGTADYSPVTVNFASGTFGGGAYASARVTNAKQPNNSSTTDYLNRYWTIGQSGITGFSSTITGTFVAADAVGSVANMITGLWTGSAPWQLLGAVSSNTITGSGITTFGDFTGVTAPSITTSVSSLTGFNYIFGSGPSAQQSFTVSGSNLVGNISIVPPTNYEISLSSGGAFVATNPITLTQTDGTVAATTIYARLKAGLAVNSYNLENITATSTSAVTKNVTASGTVSNVPLITTSVATLTGLNYIFGNGPSAQQSYTVSGTDLIGNISIAPPADYEISLTTGGAFVATNPIILTPTTGTVAATTVYVRLKAGLAINNYNLENITATSTSAVTKNVAASGTVSNIPVITTSVATLTGLNYIFGSGPSAQQSFTVSGTYLVGNISIAPPTDYEISLTSGGAFVATNPITLTPTTGTVAATTVYVRLKAGLAVNSYNLENIAATSTSAVTKNVAASGTVSNVPLITTSVATLTGFNYIFGNGPSAQQSYTVSGTYLIANISIAPPADYEISLSSGGAFVATNPITLTPTTGTVAATTVYVRLKAGLAVNSYNLENIAATSTSAVTKNVAASGTVSNVPLITTSVATLTGFNYIFGNGPSAQQSYTVSGAYLVGNISIAPPTNYEISLSSGGAFVATNPITLTPTTGTVAATTIYVRLKAGLAINSYNLENIVATSTSAVTKNVAASGTVTNVPLITTSVATLTGLNYNYGSGPSAQQSFTVSGTYLVGNILLAPPTDYEISLSSGGAFVATNPITLTPTTGTVAATTVYVRLKAGLVANSFNLENIAATSTSAVTKNVACSGTVTAVPFITTSTPSITTFDYPVGFGPSNAISFTVSGVYLQNNITVTAPTNFELSSSLPFSASNVLVIPAVAGTVSSVPVYARMKSGLPLGAVAAQNVDITSDNAATKSVACSGTVLNVPVLQITPNSITTGFTYVYASSTTPIQSFTVSGTNIVSGAPVVLTPSANFEISELSGANFAPQTSISLPHTSTPTSLASTTIYVRMRQGLGVGTQTGTVIASSTSASDQTLTLSGTVSAAPTITTSTTLLSAFLYTVGASTSQSQSFTVTGTNLGTNNITVTPPTGYEIKLSTSGTYATGAVTITPTGGNASATIDVRLKLALALGTYGPSNVALTATGAVGKAVSVTGQVVANSPLISASKSTLTGFGYLSSEGGNTQGAQSFVVSGTSLAANITVAPPANYVISTSPSSGFQSTNLTITRSGTIVAPTTIYIKLATSLPYGDYGTLISPIYVALTSGTAAPVNIKCIGKVFASPLISASGGGTFCQGEAITLHSTGVDIVKRFWEGPNSFYSSVSDPALTTSAIPSMTGTYNVTGNVYIGGNLVTNGDFEAGNSSFGSGYNYVVPGKTINANGNLWPEGYYTVDNLPNTSHNNFSACTDHTSNSGKQMIINGSPTAGVVIWSQAVPVVPNADYEFSYWVQTVVATSPSQLQLYVNGVAAGPVYTADTGTCTWKQFIYNTKAGSSTTYINLELINQNTIANGNDFALDDILFQQILSATASTSVTVNPSMPVSVTIAASANPIYQNTPVTFTATPVNGGTIPAYQWKRIRAGVTTDVGTNSPIFTTSDLISGDSIYCKLTSNIACPTGNPATSNKIGLTVNVRVNYWMGYTDTDWGKPENWTANFVPLTGDDVEYATTANFGVSAMKDLWLDVDRTIGSLINATTKRLVIPAGKGLTVNNTIYTDGNPDRVYIYSSTTGANGSLIYHNPINFPAAGTVEMYSKAWINPLGVVGQGTKFNWQYFGIPLRSLVANPSFYGAYVRKWYETGTSISNHWIQLTNSSTLVPFYGYELCQTAAKTYAFKGILENGNFSTGTLAVTYGKQGVPNALFPGQHVFANPFTAAIDIRQLSFGEGTLKTVYIYNTGTFEAWTNGGQTPTSGNNLTPGQYTSVPYNLAGVGALPRQIPSMQAIVVKTLSSTSESSLATFGINYNSATLQKNTIAQRSKSENTATTDKIYTMIEVTGDSFADKMWLFTEPNCSRGFDNGWDAEKIISDSKLTPKIYAVEPEGIYQVSTADDINNTNLTFIPGKDVTYTITVTNENVKKRYAGIYLHDVVENKVVDITESGSSYTFMADSTNTVKNRFRIATRYYEKDAPDAQSQVKVFNSGKTIFVENFSDKNGTVVLYDMAGRIIKRVSFMPNTVSAVSTNLVPGGYVAKAISGTEVITKRLIVN